MDLATENKIAAILLREASELRRQTDKEGALAYLCKPAVRGRPNSRFLTATVLGIQQANRAVEVDEMWRLRHKELDVESRNKRRLGNENSSANNQRGVVESRVSGKKHNDGGSVSSASCSFKKRHINNHYAQEEEGLRDDEVNEFLHSRAKRGRGTIGSRMDETGPYPSCSDNEAKPLEDLGFRGRSIVGPERPLWLNSSESSDGDDDRVKVSKVKPNKCHCRKQKSKRKSREKDERRYLKRHKFNK
ncbi:unnamed protein product [Cuscuta epithymum]|uniref:Uncharacterized protein n=1 Tax=Cuscuta epithymum TaxID=186058 RepID=A0AAV0FVH7_9ASTE|nr:unnamed protein product [Cuscuta epithymum]